MGKRIHDTTSDLFLNTIKMAREAGALTPSKPSKQPKRRASMLPQTEENCTA